MSTDKSSVGARLLHALQLGGYTQADAARAAEVSRTYVNDIVKDRSPPSDHFLQLLLEKLNITPEWVRFGRGSPLSTVKDEQVFVADPRPFTEAEARAAAAGMVQVLNHFLAQHGLGPQGSRKDLHDLLDQAVPDGAPAHRWGQVRGYLQALIDSDEAAIRLGRDPS